MLILFLSQLLLKAAKLILDLLPNVHIPEFEVQYSFTEIINLLYYILPMGDIATIFGLTVLITGFRIILAIINKVLNLMEVL